MGGIKFPALNNISQQIWDWCELRGIFVFASYINTKDNVSADRASRRKSIDSEYSLRIGLLGK